MMNEPIVIISGAITTAFAGVLAFIGKSRGSRAEASVALMDQVREWATQLQESEKNCRAELDVVRKEFDEFRVQVRRELNEVRACAGVTDRKVDELDPEIP